VGKRHVAVIGISNYPKNKRGQPLYWDSLVGVSKDRERFRETLKRFTDARGVEEFVWIPDDQAKRGMILARLRELAARASATDQIVVYFAGHGLCQLDTSSGIDEYYLIPYDATNDVADTGIAIGQFVDALRSNAEELIVILDCCHAGGIVTKLNSVWDPSTLNAICAGWRHIYLMGASYGHQAVLDHDLGSFFTQALCDALEGRGARPDYNLAIPVGRAFERAARVSQRKSRAFARKYGVSHDQNALATGNGAHLSLTRSFSPTWVVVVAILVILTLAVWVYLQSSNSHTDVIIQSHIVPVDLYIDDELRRTLYQSNPITLKLENRVHMVEIKQAGIVVERRLLELTGESKKVVVLFENIEAELQLPP
jgi:Caspase domain